MNHLRDNRLFKCKSQCLLTLVMAWLCLTGCSVYSLTGKTMTEYTVDHLAPHVLATQDLEMACEMGVSLGPFLMSFARPIEAEPHKAAVPTFLTAALCADFRTWEAELTYLRAIKQQQSAASQDARIVKKRANRDAAQRYWKAYQHMTALYGKGDQCPEDLEEVDELTMLMGLIAGIQAVQHDMESGREVGVPTDLPRNVLRQTRCLKSEKWWGVPKALEAAVWLVVPNSIKGTQEEVKQKAYEVLNQQKKIGRQAKVRLVDAIFAFAALALNDLKQVKLLIQEHAQHRKDHPASKRWQLLDQTAYTQLLSISDQIWTKQKGHRTPQGRFGEFEEEESEEATEDSGDDLLDGL